MDAGRQFRVGQRPILLTVVYLLFGWIWIVVSDLALTRLGVGAIGQLELQILKGLAFVLVTGMILYWELKVTTDYFKTVDRMMRSLSAVNKDLLSAKSEEELAAFTCRVLVEVGGFRHAQVWRREGGLGEKSWLRIAEAGENESVGFKDLSAVMNEAETKVASQTFLSGGYRGIVAPMVVEGAVWGMLTVHDGWMSPPKDEEVGVLTELAGDVAFGVRYLKTERSRRISNDEILKERNLFSTVVQSSPLGILLMDQRGRVVFANAGAEKIFGLTRGQLLDRAYDDPAWNVTDAEGRPMGAETLPVAVVLATKKAIEDVRFAVSRPNGERVLLLGGAVPLFEPTKELSGVVMTVEDISGEYKEEEEMKRLATFPEYSPYIIMEVDGEGRLTYANPVTKKLVASWGGNQADYRRLLPEDFKQLTEELKMGQVKSAERTIEVAGKTLAVLVNQVPGGLYRIYATDITQQKELDRLKDEFVALTSHQLRTPLSGIKWYSEMLLEQLTGKLSEKQQEYLDEVKKSNQRMIDLVNDLLKVSQIEKAVKEVLVLDRREVTKVMEEAIVVERAAADRAGVEIVWEEGSETGVTALVDEEKIRMVFENLVDNAIKFSERGDKVRVGVKWVEEKNEVVVSVSDEGIGIPEAEKEQVFERFFKASNVKEVGGSGLGLYLVKLVVEAHRGRVWFESRGGGGTTFYVALRH